jgi:hypothetical protein
MFSQQIQEKRDSVFLSAPSIVSRGWSGVAGVLSFTLILDPILFGPLIDKISPWSGQG